MNGTSVGDQIQCNSQLIGRAVLLTACVDRVESQWSEYVQRYHRTVAELAADSGVISGMTQRVKRVKPVADI